MRPEHAIARPHDVSDLYLAPLALALDAKIDELGRLQGPALRFEIALQGDHPDATRAVRETGLLTALTRNVDAHGWTFSWDARGLRLTNDGHTLVLGLPPTVLDYVEFDPVD
jgi:hypothetical protein